MEGKRTLEDTALQAKHDPVVENVVGDEEAENRDEIRRLKKQRLMELRLEVSQLKSQAKRLHPSTIEGDLLLNCVHISNLPADVLPAELKQVFSKYGLVAQDHNEEDRLKLLDNGEALLLYHNNDSVPLAIQMLDQSTFRPGSSDLIHVRPATSEETHQISQRLLTPEQKFAMKQKMERMQADLNSWDPSSHAKPAINQKYNEIRQRIFQKVAVVENMFRSLEFEIEPSLEQDIREDIREECDKHEIGSDITKITFYNNGAKVTIKFNCPELSLECVKVINDRFYDGLKLHAYVFDGRQL